MCVNANIMNKMTDRDLSILYMPYLYFDKNEPFMIDQIGYSIIRSSRRSPSFDRDIWIDVDKVDFVIEYQLYYDYDIQHMYDLEHLWVYVDHTGRVCDGEASAHGSHMNCYQYTKKVEDETHLAAYIQPGKHAVFPDGNLFKLFSDYEEVCNKLAGIDGLLVKDMFRDSIRKNSYIDYQVCTYIREHYSFQPSLEFCQFHYNTDIIVSWEELVVIIPQRINKLIKGLGMI